VSARKERRYMEESKIILSEREIPTTWYNIIPIYPVLWSLLSILLLKNQLGRKIFYPSFLPA